MSQIRELHNRAMELADEGDAAKQRGDLSQARESYHQAYLLEAQAAKLVAENEEPTRSVLLRSAAWLAINCDEIREAERLAALGLVGNPPPEIAEELREVLEKVRAEFVKRALSPQ